MKEMRRRLAKIRQLVATGQTQDPTVEETNALLFNSVYIGLDQDVDELEPAALIAAIDEELKDDVDATTQSSWQSLRPPDVANPRTRSTRVHGKRLTRSRGPSIEFRFNGVHAEVDQYRPDQALVSRTFATIKDMEILDHIKTSTWQKFLTSLRSDSHGDIRETDSNMVRIELRSVRPVPGHPSEETRLRVSILIVYTRCIPSSNFQSRRRKYYPSDSMLIKMHWISSKSSLVSGIPIIHPLRVRIRQMGISTFVSTAVTLRGVA